MEYEVKIKNSTGNILYITYVHNEELKLMAIYEAVKGFAMQYTIPLIEGDLIIECNEIEL
jgi:hypothetical protein